MSTSPFTATSAPTSHPESDWSAVIVHTPGVCSGQARIDGTRIKVKHIYRWVEEMGMTPGQVVEQYPHLNKAQVHAALAFYWSHPDEIRNDIEEEDRLVADLKAKSGPSKLQASFLSPGRGANCDCGHFGDSGLRDQCRSIPDERP